jgi:antitoxin CptB
MLENDLLIERFLTLHGDSLTQGQAGTLSGLMHMADNDLLDVLLSRRNLAEVDDGQFDSPEAAQLIELLKRKAP